MSDKERWDDVEKALDKLSVLYSLTGEDWNIRIHHTLTEPTCPMVTIQPDGLNLMRYSSFADTIREGILQAAEHVYRELVLGEDIGHAAPFTNSDDGKWTELKTRWAEQAAELKRYQASRKRDGGKT